MNGIGINDNISINGIITASEWDGIGNPVGLKLYATDETEYHLEFDKKFLDFIKKSVIVTGAYFRGTDGDMWIKKPITIENL